MKINVTEVSENYAYSLPNRRFATVALPIMSAWGDGCIAKRDTDTEATYGYYNETSRPADMSESDYGELQTKQAPPGVTPSTHDIPWQRFEANQEGIGKFISTFRGACDKFSSLKDYSYGYALTLLLNGYDIIVTRICDGYEALNFRYAHEVDENGKYIMIDTGETNKLDQPIMIIAPPVLQLPDVGAEGRRPINVVARFPGTFGNRLWLRIRQYKGRFNQKSDAGTDVKKCWRTATVFVMDDQGVRKAVESFTFSLTVEDASDTAPYWREAYSGSQTQSKFVSLDATNLDLPREPEWEENEDGEMFPIVRSADSFGNITVDKADDGSFFIVDNRNEDNPVNITVVDAAGIPQEFDPELGYLALTENIIYVDNFFVFNGSGNGTGIPSKDGSALNHRWERRDFGFWISECRITITPAIPAVEETACGCVMSTAISPVAVFNANCPNKDDPDPNVARCTPAIPAVPAELERSGRLGTDYYQHPGFVTAELIIDNYIAPRYADPGNANDKGDFSPLWMDYYKGNPDIGIQGMSQSQLKLEAVRQAALFYCMKAIPALTDKIFYEFEVLILPGWDDQNFGAEVAATAEGGTADNNDYKMSQLHRIMTAVCVWGKCGVASLDAPRFIPFKCLKNYEDGGIAQQLSQAIPQTSVEFDNLDIGLDNTNNTVSLDGEPLRSTKAHMVANWVEYTFPMLGNIRAAISPSLANLIIRRTQLKQQAIQQFWCQPTNQTHTLRFGKVDKKVGQVLLEYWQDNDRGVGVNPIVNDPQMGVLLRGNFTLYDQPEMTYNALRNLSTRYLFNEVSKQAFDAGRRIQLTYNNATAMGRFKAAMYPTLDSMVDAGAIDGYLILINPDINGLDHVNANSVVGNIYLIVNGVVQDIDIALIALPPGTDLSQFTS